MPISFEKFRKTVDRKVQIRSRIQLIADNFQDPCEGLFADSIEMLRNDIQVHKNCISDLKEKWNTECELVEEPVNRNYSSIEAQADHEYNIDVIEVKLKSFRELQVVSIYKNIEISIKQMSKIAYGDSVVKQLYKWDTMIAFFKGKGIDITLICNYKEVDEIRIVNNSVKHAAEISKPASEIKEFQNQHELSWSSLERFLDRVIESPKAFLQSLASSIIEEMFIFDDNRLDAIIDMYSGRMNADTLLRLNERLTNKLKSP